jgi:hypothetical protein
VKKIYKKRKMKKISISKEKRENLVKFVLNLVLGALLILQNMDHSNRQNAQLNRPLTV